MRLIIFHTAVHVYKINILHNIIILFPATEPRLKEYMKNITVREGQEVNLRISFTGIPRPTVTWFFNGKRMQVESQDGREYCNNDCIFIASAEGKHAGIYDFIVSNSVGSVEGCTNLKVFVKEKQQVEEKKSRSPVTSNPIKKNKFGEHVSAYHALNNSGFIEEYQVGYCGSRATVNASSYRLRFC